MKPLCGHLIECQFFLSLLPKESSRWKPCPWNSKTAFKCMWFDFLVFKTEELETAREKCPPKSVSESLQFTCFLSGLKIALSKSSCFDLHEVNEKRKNILIDYWSQVPGGFRFDCLLPSVSILLLPFYRAIFSRLMATSVSVHHSSLKGNHGCAEKDLN